MASVNGAPSGRFQTLLLLLYSSCLLLMVEEMNLFQPAFIQGIGGPELLIILVIILLLFGAKKLPELAKGLGKSMKEFKKATQDVQDDFQEAMDAVDPEKPSAQKPSSGQDGDSRKTTAEPATQGQGEKKQTSGD